MKLNVIKGQKIFNEKNMLIYPNCKEVTKLPNNYYKITTTDNTTILSDNNGNIVCDIEVSYNSRGHIVVFVFGKYYFLLSDFRLSENCFDDVDLTIGNTDLVGVCVENSWGFADTLGNIKIPTSYKHTKHFSQTTGLPLIVKKSEENYTFCNPETGEEIYKNSFYKVDYFRYHAELKQYTAQVWLLGQVNFLTTKGDFLLPDFVDEIRIENFGLLVKKNGLFGVFAFDGTLILPIIYQAISYNKKYNRFVLKYGKKYGIASQIGFVIVPCKYRSEIKMHKDFVIVTRDEELILYKIGVGELFVPSSKETLTQAAQVTKILEEEYIELLFNALSYYLN